MNSVSSRLKAIGVTALVFALSAFGLLGLIWLLAALPFAFPGAPLWDAYRPHDSIAAVSDLRAVVALTSAFLLASAAVLLVDAQYFDRMLSILADVLLMIMAAMAGFVAGYWVLLRLAGYENFLGLNFLQAALVCPLIVFAVSLLPLARIRASLLLKLLVAVLLLFGAPILLFWMS